MECYWNTITNVGNTEKNVNGEEGVYSRPYPSKVEPNPPLTLIIRENKFNYSKKLGAVRANNEDNNTALVSIIDNKLCFSVEPPANWPALYFFVPINSIITGNTSTLACN
jgi:hypothetical protein